MEDSDISVAITTTKHIYAVLEGHPPEELKSYNVPICTAQMVYDIKGNPDSLKRICKRMARTVHINSDDMFIYIGENPRIPHTALVEYYEDESHEYANDFFKQWDKLHTLLFEFVVFNKKRKILFSLKGMWDKDRWLTLDIKDKPSLGVIKTGSTRSWGTFSTHDLQRLSNPE